MPLCYHCFREKANEGPCPFCGYDGAEQAGRYPRALRPGTILNGRYIVGRVLGQGGFGITYLAQDYQSKERAAIKEYFPTEFVARATDAVSVQVDSANQGQNFDYGKAQFLEEARTLSNFIGNEHIVRIHSYFEENGTAYFVMDFIEGPSLDKYMRQFGGHLGVKEAKHLLLPLMEAMGEVHEKGIVHRDIAPDNIIVTGDGTAKLIDFGAARYSTGEKSKSLDVILKHGFAPYEQYMRRGRQGPWTDVYAMAATFYYAITGKVPPEATERKEEDTLIPPSTFGVKIDDATEEALLKALEVRAADRFQSMADFCAAMRGETPAVRKPQAAPRNMEEAAAPARRPAGSIAQPGTETGAAPNAGKKKSGLPLALAAVLVLAAVIFGVTRFGGSKAENPAVTEDPAPVLAEPIIATPEPTSDPRAEQYAEAEALLEEGHYGKAWSVFTALGDYEDSDERANQIAVERRVALSKPIATCSYHTVGRKTDGTVIAVGWNEYGQCDTSKWTDIVSVAAGYSSTIGLRSDGTVVIIGSNYYSQSDVADLSNVIAISSGEFHAVFLLADGTAISVGRNNCGQCNVSDWTDIVAVDAGYEHTVGLRADGTVVAVGKTDSGQCDVTTWKNIVSISAGSGYTLGLRADGTVVAAGSNYFKQCNVSGWRDVVAVDAASEHSVGLLNDGTVVAVGDKEKNRCNVDGWKDIIAVAAGMTHTIGLKSDGSVIAVGVNEYNPCDVSGWKDISFPSISTEQSH